MVHLPYLKQMLNSWATQYTIIPQDWKDLATAIVAATPQWKEEARTREEQNGARVIDISQDQILGEGQYSDSLRQFGFDYHTFALCLLEALNAWNKVEELGNRSELFTKILQGTKRIFH